MATSRQPSPASSTSLFEAVRFGQPPEQGQQGRLDRALDCGDVEIATRGALQGHVVQPDAPVPRADPQAWTR